MAETMTKDQIDAAVEGMSKPGIGGACERLRIMALTFKDAGSVAAMIPLGLAPKIARDVADVLAEIESLRSRLESAERDTERLDLAQKLLIGADFAWGDPDNPSAIVAIAMPIGTRIGTDLRAFLDASLALIRPASTSTDSEVGKCAK